MTRPLAAAVLAALVAAMVAVTPSSSYASQDHRLVDPFIGTGGALPWGSGNTSPAATRPFGMVQLGPDTTAGSAGTPSAGPSGYRADEPLLRGFSATHLSGAGCATFGDVPILPVVGALPADPGAATVAMVGGSQRASPGSYRVGLANGAEVSLAAGVRSGLMRVAFGGPGRARILVKAAGSLAGTTSSSVRFVDRREIAVTATSGGFCDASNRYRIHVLLRFEHPYGRHGTWGGSRGGAWVDVGPDRLAKIQVGVSFVSIAGARRNLVADRLGWSVGDVATSAAAAWASTLDRVRAEGGTTTERTLFDTALYRVFSYPSVISDADGRYPGADGRTHRLPPGDQQLSSISGWDFYRTQAPLLAWIRPDIAAEVVRSLLRDAQQSGRLPRWPLVGSETGIMSGDSAAPVIAAIQAFGVRDFDLDQAVAQLVRQGDDVRSTNGDEPRPGLESYLSRGFVPDPFQERGELRSWGASTTLEYATDDFAVSRLAAAAGDDDVASRFRARSGSWRALLDPTRQQLVPRDASGDFPSSAVDATACCAGFEEGNALQYTWGGVPQDVGGLLTALGSPDDVAARLDAFFEELNAGGGPHAWLGNEPSFSTPWDFYWLARPALGEDVVARARHELWSTGPSGLPGNDDLGALSAWYVWSSLGLYPVTPGEADLAIGVPAFSRITVRPRGGAVVSITRSGTGRHVGAVEVDGVPHPSTWLSLARSSSPRTVSVTTTDVDQPPWGAAAGEEPPSHP